MRARVDDKFSKNIVFWCFAQLISLPIFRYRSLSISWIKQKLYQSFLSLNHFNSFDDNRWLYLEQKFVYIFRNVECLKIVISHDEIKCKWFMIDVFSIDTWIENLFFIQILFFLSQWHSLLHSTIKAKIFALSEVKIQMINLFARNDSVWLQTGWNHFKRGNVNFKLARKWEFLREITGWDNKNYEFITKMYTHFIKTAYEFVQKGQGVLCWSTLNEKMNCKIKAERIQRTLALPRSRGSWIKNAIFESSEN